MIFTRRAALAVIAACAAFSMTPAEAQSRSAAQVPAEFPPAGFSGNQFADSRGCVYIRAGIDGNTTWVPRVTRSREAICSAQPTFARRAAEPAPTPVLRPQATEAAPAPVVRPQQARPQPAPQRTARAEPRREPIRTIAAPQPAPVQRRVTPAPRVVLPSPTIGAPVAVAPAPQQVVRVTRQTSGRVVQQVSKGGSCPGASALSQHYINPGARCGPQTQSSVTLVRRGETPKADGSNLFVMQQTDRGTVLVPKNQVASNTRIVPRHLYDPQNRTTRGIDVPSGFQSVERDDRLNTQRAVQTPQGVVQTRLLWTNTVPRRLIDANTRRDASKLYPELIYPFTDMAGQRAYLATQSKAKAPRAVAAAPMQVRREAPASGGGAYVQVGTFGNPSNAQNTAQRLQNAGMPVRMGRYSKGGKTLQVVMAGPFSSSAQTQNALNAVRRAGFGDAFVRR